MRTRTSSPVTAVAILALGLLLAAGAASAGWDEGVAAFRAEDFVQATSELEKAVEQSPEEWRGHYLLGLSLGAQGKKEEALRHLRKAYDLNPNDLSLKNAFNKLSSASGKRLQRVSADLGQKWLDQTAATR